MFGMKIYHLAAHSNVGFPELVHFVGPAAAAEENKLKLFRQV
jgi:hypothetical protein